MTLKETITSDLTNAMKEKDAARLSTLRMLKAAIMKFEVSGTQKKDASDQEVETIIQKEIKQRRDSIDAFNKGGKADMAKAEEVEMQLLKQYLPPELSEDEIKQIILNVLVASGASTKADFGKVMGMVTAQTKGRADGNLVSKLVGELLK